VDLLQVSALDLYDRMVAL